MRASTSLRHNALDPAQQQQEQQTTTTAAPRGSTRDERRGVAAWRCGGYSRDPQPGTAGAPCWYDWRDATQPAATVYAPAEQGRRGEGRGGGSARLEQLPLGALASVLHPPWRVSPAF